MKLKITIFFTLFIFLFYLSLFVAGFLPFIAEHKINFSPDVIWDYTLDIIFHPIMNIKEMHSEQNPMLYLCTGAAFGLFIYLFYKTRQKDYENVGDKYGVQGSARWATTTDIFKVPKQIKITSKRKLYKQLKKSLKNSEVRER